MNSVNCVVSGDGTTEAPAIAQCDHQFFRKLSRRARRECAHSAHLLLRCNSTSTSAADAAPYGYTPIGGAGERSAQKPKHVADKGADAADGDAAAGQPRVTMVKRWQVALDQQAKSLWTDWPVAHQSHRDPLSGNLCQYLSNTHEIVVWSWSVMQK